MHVGMLQEPFCAEIQRYKAADQTHGADFVRADAVETHMDISQGPLYSKRYREIYRSKAADQAQAKLAAQTLHEPVQSKCTRLSRAAAFQVCLHILCICPCYLTTSKILDLVLQSTAGMLGKSLAIARASRICGYVSSLLRSKGSRFILGSGG